MLAQDDVLAQDDAHGFAFVRKPCSAEPIKAVRRAATARPPKVWPAPTGA